MVVTIPLNLKNLIESRSTGSDFFGTLFKCIMLIYNVIHIESDKLVGVFNFTTKERAKMQMSIELREIDIGFHWTFGLKTGSRGKEDGRGTRGGTRH
jgi:hypothetical protein